MSASRFNQRFHMIAKPTSYHCNIKCTYCFYLEKEELMQHADTRYAKMSDSMLKRYTKEYIHSQPSDEVDFVWQGGEPTLAGLDFFKNAVKYQKQFSNGKTINNSFQTNGIALNRQWAAFFAEHDFLIGISIEGLAEIHDKYRISTNGNPTFSRVKESIALLKEYNVEFNTLTVINDQNWDKGKQTYQALKELGSDYLQFIPIVEVQPDCQGNAQGHYVPIADPKLTSFSVPAEGYGRFMTDVFNEWVVKDVGKVYVRMFDSILSTWLGHPPSVCVQGKDCGQAMVIESNGDIYSCDHYVYPANKLGNIKVTDMTKLATSKRQQRFGTAKSTRLTENCKQCDVRSLCHGGCPKHRIVTIAGDKYKQNHLCSSYKKIFKHTAPAMQYMVNAIEHGRTAADIMPLMPQFYPR